jgi:hypothetical protein
VDFGSGKAGFVRMELRAEIVQNGIQNGILENETEGKYVLQKFRSI